MSVGKLGEF